MPDPGILKLIKESTISPRLSGGGYRPLLLGVARRASVLAALPKGDVHRRRDVHRGVGPHDNSNTQRDGEVLNDSPTKEHQRTHHHQGCSGGEQRTREGLINRGVHQVTKTPSPQT